MNRPNFEHALYEALFPDAWMRASFPKAAQMFQKETILVDEFHYHRPKVIAEISADKMFEANKKRVKKAASDIKRVGDSSGTKNTKEKEADEPKTEELTRFQKIRIWYLRHADQNTDAVIKIALIRRISKDLFSEEERETPENEKARRLFLTPLMTFLSEVVACVAVAVIESITLAIGIIASVFYYPVMGIAFLFNNKTEISPYLAKNWLALPAYRLINKIVLSPWHLMYTLCSVITDMYRVNKMAYGDNGFIRNCDLGYAIGEACFDKTQDALRAIVGLRPLKREKATSEVKFLNPLASSETSSPKATCQESGSSERVSSEVVTHRSSLLLFMQGASSARGMTVAAVAKVAALTSRSGTRLG